MRGPVELVHNPATCAHCAKARDFLRDFLGDPRVIVSQSARGPYGPSVTTAEEWKSTSGGAQHG